MELQADLIKIGEFARLGGVSIKALRLYSSLGLLRPAAITRSKYRLYSQAQLSTLHRILVLKNAGLALAQLGGQLGQRDEAALTRIREISCGVHRRFSGNLPGWTLRFARRRAW